MEKYNLKRKEGPASIDTSYYYSLTSGGAECAIVFPIVGEKLAREISVAPELSDCLNSLLFALFKQDHDALDAEIERSQDVLQYIEKG